MENYNDPEIINVGTGTDVTIRELAEMVQRLTGFTGSLRFDPSKPDGTPRKLLDVSRLTRLGWRPRYTLESGLVDAYRWFVEHYAKVSAAAGSARA